MKEAMELDSNAGCHYMLRWDNIFDNALAVELFWESNLDIPLEAMEPEEIEETMEYIFNEFVGSKVANPDDWYMAEYEPIENCGY